MLKQAPKSEDDHLKGFPLTICLYEDRIYTINILTGTGDFKLSPSSQQPITEYSENTILCIDPDHTVSFFAKLDNNEVIDTIKARDDQIFVLAHHRVQKVKYVHVFNMSGQRITSWQHPDSYRSFANGLIVTNELVIVADISNKRTTVYSRSRPGEVIKHVPSPEFSTGYRNGICEVCDGSFITLSGMNDVLYKVNIATGKEESRHCIIWPRTVARVSDTKMLIVCSIDSSIHLVDMNKGGSKEIKLGEQHDFIFDVDIYENQLVLTTRNGKQNSVAIYDLEFVATTDV